METFQLTISPHTNLSKFDDRVIVYNLPHYSTNAGIETIIGIILRFLVKKI